MLPLLLGAAFVLHNILIEQREDLPVLPPNSQEAGLVFTKHILQRPYLKSCENFVIKVYVLKAQLHLKSIVRLSEKLT